MRPESRSVLATLLLALSATGVGAQEKSAPSNEGALFLLLPVGAKAVAMGRAMTAMQGIESAFWNPAGLASVEDSRAVLFRGDHAVGTATTAISALFARPGVGTVGASYLLLDAGDQDLTDADGNILGTISVRNHLGIASVAARLLGRLNVGVNFKIVQFRFSCRGICPDAGTTATTYAIDAGVQLEPTRDLPLRVGAMVAHVGPALQVLNAEQADPRPARARVAVAYDVLHTLAEPRDVQGWVTVEVQDRIRDPGSLSFYVGAELQAGQTEALFLRAGYVASDIDQEDGVRVGLGLRYQRFELGIAKSLAASILMGETEPVHVTFSIGF